MNEDYLSAEHNDPFYEENKIEKCVYGRDKATTYCYFCAVPLCAHCGYIRNKNKVCNDCNEILERRSEQKRQDKIQGGFDSMEEKLDKLFKGAK